MNNPTDLKNQTIDDDAFPPHYSPWGRFCGDIIGIKNKQSSKKNF
jgi:hypothetical protein